MLRHLHLKDTGPSRELKFEFAPRLNVLTGDNGLGKSFVLDVAWWTLTTTWAGEQAFPWRPVDGTIATELRPEISAVLAREVDTHDHSMSTGGDYNWKTQRWARKPWLHRGPNSPGEELVSPASQSWLPQRSLVVYARIDGTFAVWDAYQVTGTIADFPEAAVVLDPHELWDGKTVEVRREGRHRIVSRGLLDDWVTWQNTSGREFAALKTVLRELSEPDEPLVLDRPSRVRLDDKRDIPTLVMPYGKVPVTLASAGQRRVLAMAYILVWAWTEHLRAAELTQRQPVRDMVVLIDEVELHLHPRWQRHFLPSLIAAIKAIAPDVSVQLIATTHAPLVLASLEPLFDEDSDNLYRFEREGSTVRVENLGFAKQGDAGDWLASETFGLELPRSIASEAAINAASAFMRGDLPTAEAELRDAVRDMTPPPDPSAPLKRRIHSALVRLLPDHDSFWPRWIVSYERDSPG